MLCLCHLKFYLSCRIEVISELCKFAYKLMRARAQTKILCRSLGLSNEQPSARAVYEP